MTAPLPLLGPVMPGVWRIDPSRSRVFFRMRHFTLRWVRGSFSRFGGEISVSEDIPRSTATGLIDMASLDTGDAARDEFLRSENFFDVGTFPHMVYTSRRISGGGRELTVDGELTLRRSTAPIRLKVRWRGDGKAGPGTNGDRPRLFLAAVGQVDRESLGVVINTPIMGSRAVLGRTVHIGIRGEAVLLD
ncbi:Polyisoprenoid-binding protein YceI [Sinosporangium album]|uniref:Polyisoprenoid-binding protein YceI n=1 Tax=Sinosporangium album TaxID=504805 RepID=A0A1G7Z453_9ACTN|nr:YceI family protein [Sinosporangium album]SDH03444.1 Polyisoprenoid-binding protein YceI [Sinosporangium album]